MGDRPSTEQPVVLAGRYELSALLGTGGMAEVFRARDTLLGRDVAIKVFRTAVTEDRFDARQQGEIGLLARLNHPGLVTIFDAGSGDFPGGTHRAYLVMELVAGRSLGDRLARGPVPPAQTALVGAQVAESLAYIHEAGVVHRDVKPANILLPGGERRGTTQAWAKLTDFGIARLVEDAHLTSTGLLLGTPGYLSPEQATGASPGPPTDVYALGLVVLECRTGVRAFPGTALESATARLHRDPEIPAALGQGWTEAITAMTARQLEDRPTAVEAGALLRALVATPTATRVMAAVAAPSPASRAAQTVTLGAVVPPAASAVPAAAAAAARRPVAAHLTGPLRAVAAALILGVVGGGIWLGSREPGSAATPPPSYPEVSGQLGTSLEQLQRSVVP